MLLTVIAEVVHQDDLVDEMLGTPVQDTGGGKKKTG